jgi:signal recognition particle receptor subunit beta
MVLFNYSTKELTAKVVYYGPGLCGKTTNLQWIHEKLPIRNKGKMLSLATETDRTLFFDFLPIELGSIRGMKTRIQLYTVPGQVFYNATRRMVLKGADGIVFVCDSQEAMIDANVESLENLKENLVINEIDPDTVPIVLQYNKRDLPNAAPLEMLNARLNPRGWPTFEASAIKGVGVEETLKGVTAVVFRQLSTKYGGGAPAAGASAPAPTAAPPPAPVAAAPRPAPAPPPPARAPEPVREPEVEPMAASTDDLLDDLESQEAPAPEMALEADDLHLQPEPELQLDEMPSAEPMPMEADFALDEAPAAAGNGYAAVDEMPLESFGEEPAAELSLREPAFHEPEPEAPPVFDEEPAPVAPSPVRPVAATAAATIPVTVLGQDTQADIAIPLQITLQGQTTTVHLTLRLTLDLRLPG